MKTEQSGHEDVVTVAVIERYQDAPDECTIFPDARYHTDTRQTEWISAKEGSFVSLAFVR